MQSKTVTTTRKSKLTIPRHRRRIMVRRALNKVSGGHSYMDAIAKVIAKHKIPGADMLALAMDVFRLAVRRRQLTRAEARAQMAEVLGTK
ncbi:MAG: hypothetical protein GY838_12925 [bacterium]|nr:hypothetical protein [bacterium]